MTKSIVRCMLFASFGMMVACGVDGILRGEYLLASVFAAETAVLAVIWMMMGRDVFKIKKRADEPAVSGK